MLGVRCVLALLVIGVAGVAHAQQTVVLSVGGNGPAELASAARRTVIEALAADEVDVLPEADVAARIAPERLEGVGDLAAARAIAFELEVRAIVAVALWLREEVDPPVVDRVVVTLVTGSRSFVGQQEVGEAGLDAALWAAVGAARAQQTRALLVEGGTESQSESGPGSESGSGSGSGSEAGSGSGSGAEAGSGETPGYDIIGPTMLAAIGAGSVGLGVYSLLDPTCDVRGPSGACLRGDEPNVPLGATLTVVGILAVGGSIVWFITGAPIGNQERIDVVIGPGSLGARGRF